MPRSLAVLVFAAAFALVSPASARADLLLNEVLYDPDGPDEGLEFVELWNPDSASVSLEGIVVEAGDGANPGSWTPLYAGAPGDSAGPQSAFLIPATALRASIQNGPDALRLLRALETAWIPDRTPRTGRRSPSPRRAARITPP